MVFFAHCGWERMIPGGLGVTVFFCISGYLITTLLRVEYETSAGINLKNFWVRRSLRILPPFYLLLLVAYGSTLISGNFGLDELKAFFAQVFHVTNYYIIYNRYAGFPEGFATGIYWSLAVEEHFYILFPFLFLLLKKCRLTQNAQFIVLTAICCTVLLWRVVLVHGEQVPIDRIYMGTDTRLDSILFGCILAMWRNPALDPPLLRPERMAYVILPLAVAALLGSLLIRDAAFRESFRYSIQGVSLMVIISAAVQYPRWPVFGWLNSRVMEFIGKLSYSLYLVHFGIIFNVIKFLHIDSIPLRAVISFPIALVVSWMMYAFLEKPCARLRRRLID